MEQMDIATREHRTDAYAAINPMRRLPALLLDDGTAIAESIAICRYFEGLDPDPPLFGRGTLECALVEMWNRRVEFHLFLPVSSVFQHLHPFMKALVDPAQVPEWGEANKPCIAGFLKFLDGELSKRPYCGGPGGCQCCRHHRAGRGRFHESIEAAGARRSDPFSPPLVRRGVGAPERGGLICELRSASACAPNPRENGAPWAFIGQMRNQPRQRGLLPSGGCWGRLSKEELWIRNWPVYSAQRPL